MSRLPLIDVELEVEEVESQPHVYNEDSTDTSSGEEFSDEDLEADVNAMMQSIFGDDSEEESL